MVAELAGATPGDTHRAATLRLQRQSRQIVLASTVYHLGPTGASPVVHANVARVVEDVSG